LKDFQRGRNVAVAHRKGEVRGVWTLDAIAVKDILCIFYVVDSIYYYQQERKGERKAQDALKHSIKH
jgi:hypothetical protein